MSTTCRKTSIAIEDVIDVGPPGGRCQLIWQHPPPRLKTMSMVGPLGALSTGPIASTIEVEDDVDSGPPRERYQ
jgi:hypothetical protein